MTSISQLFQVMVSTLGLFRTIWIWKQIEIVWPPRKLNWERFKMYQIFEIFALPLTLEKQYKKALAWHSSMVSFVADSL